MPVQGVRYTVEQYSKLPEAHKDALARVGEYLGGGSQYATDEELSRVFGILAKGEGFVPAEYAAEDLLLSIRTKFACIWYAACQIVESRRRDAGRDDLLCLLIDPSYDDLTHCAIVDDASPGRCYVHEYYKAWSYAFDTLAEVADEVLKLVGRIEAADVAAT